MRIIITIFSLLFLISCSQKKSIRGSEYIPRDTFIEVLKDIHLVDGVTNDVKYYRKYNPKDSVDLYSPIFDKYDVTREKYEATLEAYSQNPTLLDQVYDEVLMQLNMMKDNLTGEEQREPEPLIKSDSISKTETSSGAPTRRPRDRDRRGERLRPIE